ACGMTCCNVTLATIAIWTPSFLIRVHELPLRSAGLAAAFAVGVCGALGAGFNGAIADRIGRRNEWKKLLVPVIGVSMSIVLGLSAFLLVEGATLAVAMMGLMAFVGQSFIGVGYGLASSLAPLAMRAATISILLVSFNVLSYGLGTLVVGAVSDASHAVAGSRSIGVGMASALFFSLIGMLSFWRAATLLRARS
ncbi:MAG TPA: hypothetical protein VHK24_02820, partial [Steroidobacter sp.]|nr:hypothetical protein [Steroidobacter sp.]